MAPPGNPVIVPSLTDDADATAPAANVTGRGRSGLPRFGLRMLFVVAILFCLLAAWIGRNAARVRQEQAALEALLQVDAKVELATDGDSQLNPSAPSFLSDLPEASWGDYVARSVGWAERPRISSVELSGDYSSDAKMLAALDALSVFPEIESVNLIGSAFDDETIARLEHVDGLERLSLSGTEVTSAGLARLSQTAHLRDVYVHYVSTDVLAALPRFVELRSVHISMTDVSANDMQGIASLPMLEELRLTHVRRTGDESLFAPLKNALNLKSLHLRDIDFSLSHLDLATISEIRSLETLYLGRITEEQLASFDLPPSLKKIGLGTPVTDDGARAFSALHPELLVSHSYAWGGPLYQAGEYAP